MLIAFDLDDTLIDTFSALRGARESVVRRFSHRPRTDALDRWQRASHFFDSEDFASVLPLVIPGLRPELIDVDEVRRMYWEHEIDNVAFVPGAEQLLSRLQARAVGLALVTNGPREKQERKVERLGLARYVASRAIVYADGVHVPRKPNPTAIRRALQICGADPTAAYYVGDRVSDVVAAHLARVTPILVKSPSLVVDPPPSPSALEIEGPLHTLERLCDLLPIVDGAGASRPRRADRRRLAGAAGAP